MAPAGDDIVALGQGVDRDTPVFDFALRFVGFEHVNAVPCLHILQRRIVEEIEINRRECRAAAGCLRHSRGYSPA